MEAARWQARERWWAAEMFSAADPQCRAVAGWLVTTGETQRPEMRRFACRTHPR